MRRGLAITAVTAAVIVTAAPGVALADEPLAAPTPAAVAPAATPVPAPAAAPPVPAPEAAAATPVPVAAPPAAPAPTAATRVPAPRAAATAPRRAIARTARRAAPNRLSARGQVQYGGPASGFGGRVTIQDSSVSGCAASRGCDQRPPLHDYVVNGIAVRAQPGDAPVLEVSRARSRTRADGSRAVDVDLRVTPPGGTPVSGTVTLDAGQDLADGAAFASDPALADAWRRVSGIEDASGPLAGLTIAFGDGRSSEGTVTTVVVTANREVLAVAVPSQSFTPEGGGEEGGGGGGKPVPQFVSGVIPAAQSPPQVAQAVLAGDTTAFVLGSVEAGNVISDAFGILATSSCQAFGADCGGSHAPQPVAFVVAVLGDSTVTIRRDGRGELTLSCPADLGAITGRFELVDPATGRRLAHGRFACGALTRFLRVRFRLRSAALDRLTRDGTLAALVRIAVDAAPFEVVGAERRLDLRAASG